MENKSEKFINICLSTDNNYVQHCVVTMASILKNCGNDYKVRFFILDGGISEENKRNIKKLAKIKDFVISYYDMTKIDFSDLPLNRSRISVATYYRLYLLDILPKDIKKLIYLDCDIVVKTDIAELWETDISGYYAGVVEDEGGKTQQKRLCLPFDYKYFNAGVILFNLEELRTFDFKESCLKYYENNKDIIILQDQDILNAIENHTTGRPAMSLLEKIVFVADYIEPRRNKASNLSKLRQMAFIDIDRTVYEIMDQTLRYLKAKKVPIDSLTKKSCDYYRALCGEKDVENETERN